MSNRRTTSRFFTDPTPEDNLQFPSVKGKRRNSGNDAECCTKRACIAKTNDDAVTHIRRSRHRNVPIKTIVKKAQTEPPSCDIAFTPSTTSRFFTKVSRDRVYSCKLLKDLEKVKPVLIQEIIAMDSSPYKLWKLIIAVTFLNVTTGKQALPVFWKILKTYTTPQVLSQAIKERLVDMIAHLGLGNIRAERLISLSQRYLEDPPVDSQPRPSRCKMTAAKPPRSKKRKQANTVNEEELQLEKKRKKRNTDPPYPPTPISHLPGVGRYALDSYRIFCSTSCSEEWRIVMPHDKELVRYLRWKWAYTDLKKWLPGVGVADDLTEGDLEYLVKDLTR